MLESQHRSPLDVGESCSSERLTSAKSLVEGLSTETMVVGSPCMPVEGLLIERGYFDLNGIEGWIVRFKPCMKSFFDSSGDGNVIFVPFLFFFVRRTLVMNNWGRLILGARFSGEGTGLLPSEEIDPHAISTLRSPANDLPPLGACWTPAAAGSRSRNCKLDDDRVVCSSKRHDLFGPNILQEFAFPVF